MPFASAETKDAAAPAEGVELLTTIGSSSSQRRALGLTPLVIPGQPSQQSPQQPFNATAQKQPLKSSISPGMELSRKSGKRITNYMKDPDNPYFRSPFDNESREGAFWGVVSSIVGIQQQADGAGGRERDTALDQKEITSFDFEFLRVRGVLSPHDPYHTAWEIFSGLFVVYTAMEVPFRIGFLFYTAPSLGALVVEYIIVVVFLLDMVVNFLTAYVDETTNILVYDHNKIAIRYVSVIPFWFWMDLISTFPFEAFAVGANAKSQESLATLKIFRLLRLFRIAKLFRLLNSEGLQR